MTHHDRTRRSNPTFPTSFKLQLQSNRRPLLAALISTLIVLTSGPGFANNSPAFANNKDTSATEGKLTAPQRSELADLLQQSQARTLELVLKVPESKWHQRPNEDQWSVGEVVEHLILAEGAIRGRIDQLLAGDPYPGWQKLEQLSLADLVATGADRTQKFTAPEPITPTGTLSKSESLQRFVSGRSDSLHFLLTTDAALAKVAAPSPVGAVLDGGSWIGLLGAHNMRHNAQIEEILALLK